MRIKKDEEQLVEGSESKLFKEFCVLVEQNFKKMYSVTEYANRLGVSPKLLDKHFQRQGLPSPRDYVKERILLEAKNQLIYTNHSISEIAIDLGFKDPVYFIRFFTNSTSKSPLEFKKDHKK